MLLHKTNKVIILNEQESLIIACEALILLCNGMERIANVINDMECTLITTINLSHCIGWYHFTKMSQVKVYDDLKVSVNVHCAKSLIAGRTSDKVQVIQDNRNSEAV